MQIVIDIPEEAYDFIKRTGYHTQSLYEAIKNGTPLPKGHGDLVDYREMKNIARKYGAYTEAALSHVKPKTIIEADRM